MTQHNFFCSCVSVKNGSFVVVSVKNGLQHGWHRLDFAMAAEVCSIRIMYEVWASMANARFHQQAFDIDRPTP